MANVFIVAIRDGSKPQTLLLGTTQKLSMCKQRADTIPWLPQTVLVEHQWFQLLLPSLWQPAVPSMLFSQGLGLLVAQKELHSGPHSVRQPGIYFHFSLL